MIRAQHPGNDRYKELVFKAYFRGAVESGGALIAINRQDGRIIGSSRYHGYDCKASLLAPGFI